MTSPTPGTRIINGRYEIIRHLGTGAFGAVYEVLDHHMGRKGALKLLGASAPSGHPWAEARMLMALDGPYVLPVQNADVTSGQQFIVTELAEAGTVADQIVPGIGIPVEQARLWGRDICNGVDRLHRQGLLHRDVKPENMFITEAGTAIVGDVGLAQSQNAAGLAIAAGSRQTMAPEVAAAFVGGPALVYSARSDVYSVGATLYWMLAGDPVLPEAKTFADVTTMPAKDIWQIAPHVPAPLRNAVMKAVSADPADRFASMLELDAAIGGVATPARHWNQVPAHVGHSVCFIGRGRSAEIRLCAQPGSRSGRVALTAEYASGRRIPSVSREVREAQLPAAIRTAIRLCD